MQIKCCLLSSPDIDWSSQCTENAVVAYWLVIWYTLNIKLLDGQPEIGTINYSKLRAILGPLYYLPSEPDISLFNSVLALSGANFMNECIGPEITYYSSLHLCIVPTTSSDYESSTASDDVQGTTTSDVYQDTTTSSGYESSAISDDARNTTTSEYYEVITISNDYDVTTASNDYQASSAFQYRSTVTVIVNNFIYPAHINNKQASMAQYAQKAREEQESGKFEPFSPADVQRMQSMLSRKLGPEHVSTRQGMGGIRLSYIEGWRIISIANQVFGFNGWRSSIQNLSIDYIDVVEGERFCIGASCVVRVTLRDGTYREDVGFGMIENTKSKGQALEKVKKEAVTDGLKRAMRQFGNVLGNCVYDKDYLKNMNQVQKQPRGRITGDTLFRYADLENGNNDSNGSNNGPPGQQQNNDTAEFDLDYMYDDVLDMMVDLETDRPIIPEYPSSGYVDDAPLTRDIQKHPVPSPQTPANKIHTPMSTASSVNSNSTPGSVRPNEPFNRNQMHPPSARNLSFGTPPQPPHAICDVLIK
ncbi:DNA repair protein rad52 [Coemansia spiralis]|uniref:DNA repair protein rad52 n=1 Tax=Coemansia spiralis TaxID=417178 RepID=A0A9W8L0Q5_9FUNG|nr:DNA repair protein rad52 [Coemansia spiralis]